MLKIERYTFGTDTFGTGDRFSHQGRAQVQAILKAREAGVEVHPVWNKSNREHSIIKSKPADVRAEADAAEKALGWTGTYHVDADHIGLKTVDAFTPASDFFTLDVTDFIGKAAETNTIEFLKSVHRYRARFPFPELTSLSTSLRKRCWGQRVIGKAVS